MSEEPLDLEDFYAPCNPIVLQGDAHGNFGGFAHYLARLAAEKEQDGQAVVFSYHPNPEEEDEEVLALKDIEYILLDSMSNKKKAFAAILNRMNQKAQEGLELYSRLVYFFNVNTDMGLMDGNLEVEDFEKLFAMAERTLLEDDFSQLRQALGIFVHSGQVDKKGNKQFIHFHVIYALPLEVPGGCSVHSIRRDAAAYTKMFLDKYDK